MAGIKVLSDDIFDLDKHPIPANEKKQEGKHTHYEAMFLMEADMQEQIVRQKDESNDVRWIQLTEVKDYTDSHNMLRMVEKTAKVVGAALASNLPD